MASGSVKPPAEEPSRPAPDAPAAAAAGGRPPRGSERYGPLRVLRTRKDDGRALTLYSVEADEER